MIVMNFGSQDKKRNITMSKYRNIPLDVNDKDDGEKTRSPIADVSRGEQGRTKTTAIVKRDRVTSLVRRSAFTIIELLIVITVVSLLALLVVPVVSRAYAHSARPPFCSPSATTIACRIPKTLRIPRRKSAEHSIRT
jgi:prepilin-type N-terminal cleavage/methylation domain-containing protein